MNKYFYLLLLCLNFTALMGQDPQTLRLNQEQIETLFLQNNLELIAERMNIDLADAEIIQARLWDNPELSINDLNLWSSKSQREGESEAIPPVFGKFMRNTQFSIELGQLIQTANKRGKLVRREKVGKQIIEKEFEQLLQALKLELRQSVSDIIYLQSYITTLLNQQSSLQDLVNTYKKLVEQGNIAKRELIRLQSALLEVDNEHYEVEVDLNKQLLTLKVLLSLEVYVSLEIIDEKENYIKPSHLALSELLSIAEDNRPDLQASKLGTEYLNKSLSYEKSLRIPDIKVSAAYDRRGGVWRDFIGFGVSIDLPVFNRNQGGIRMAKIGYEQSLFENKQEMNRIQHKVASAYNNYMLAYKLYEKINNENLLSEIEKMQGVYARYLLKQDISMLEYIDFMEAYKTNMQTVLGAKKQLRNQFQELQFTIGTDIN